MNMNVYQIKMKLLTKIPKNENIELTSSLLQHTVKKPLSNYPFFTDSKPFPKNKLQSLTYDEIVTFFFNNKRFNSVMKNVYMQNKTKKKNYKIMNIKKDKNKDVNNTDFSENKNKFENFIIMLQLLFPTTFPLVNNIETSLSYVLPNKTENIPFEKNNVALNKSKFLSFKGTTTKLLRFLPNKFNRKFSYLNINKTIYTISNVIWINDVMNHPIYKEILLKYNVFEQWRTNYESKLDEKEKKERNELIKFILRIMQKTNNPLDFKKIELPQMDDKNIKSSTKLSITQFIETNKKLQEMTINDYNDENKQSIIIDLFISLINSFNSLNTREYFSGSYENLKNIGRKVNEYELNRDIHDYIFDLNFEYLNEDSSDSTSNERRNMIITKINNFFPEFNNFIKTIREMKNRKIDNPIWKNIINKIIQGEKDHNFQSLWNEINNCYSISDVDDINDENDENERKKRTKNVKEESQTKVGGNSKCKNNNDELNVGFDILISEYKKDPKENNDNYGNIPIIEIYLQINTIKGLVNENNMNILNCSYNDIFLGNMYTNLLYNPNEQWNIKEHHMFFDAQNILKNNPEKK